MTFVDELEARSWTWVGPTVREDEGRRSFEMRIRELPDFFVAAETREGVLQEKEEALRAFLLSYLDRGELPPLPKIRAS